MTYLTAKDWAISKLCVLEWVYSLKVCYVKWAAALAMWCEASRVKHWLCEVEQQYAVSQANSALFNIVSGAEYHQALSAAHPAVTVHKLLLSN